MEVHCNTDLPLETREISITNSSLHSRKIEKEQTKPKISIKKAIIKIRIQIKKSLKDNRKYQQT